MTAAQNSSSPAALLALAQQSLVDKKYDAAAQHLDAVLAQNADNAPALALLAEIDAARNDLWNALKKTAQAMRLDIGNMDYKKQFLRFGRNIERVTFDADIDQAVLTCLQTPDLDFAGANVLWGSMLLQRPSFRLLLAHVYWRGIFARKFLPLKTNPFASIKNFALLLEPYFLLGIRKNVANQLIFEQLMVFLRSFLLDEATAAQPKMTAEDYLTLTAAVAQYAFHTDYILETSPAEQAKVDALQQKLETAIEAAPITVALVACYTPLYRLRNAAALAKQFSALPILADLIEEHIAEHQILQDWAQKVPTLTPVDDGVSEKVRGQYEEFPYPRWRAMEHNPDAGAPKDVTKMSRLNSRIYSCLSQPHAQVLIAGCGTGKESNHLAALFPTASILAIDITRASLAYATRKAEAYGLKNISFGQADILKLESLGRSFDYISSFGVLHHMRDPEAGWAVLARLLKPGGMMNIGLYSNTARHAIIAARAAIAKDNYPATAAGMRQFRKDSPKLLSKKTLAALTQTSDYYYLNMYRDLLFHVQEDRFDIPRIKTDLKNLGLTFEGFKVPGAVASHYLQLFPDDPSGLNLDHWHSYEQANPDTFLECYAFWCRKPEA